ncbi:lipoprotein [Desulfuromonas sp. AOP6]|nr:lipoprotein [Desulfuromonas sp. AOP6]
MLLRTLIIVFFLIFLAACTPAKGIYHQVGEGQTLYRISRVYGVNEQYLARVNGISDPSRLQAGQKLFVPGAVHQRKVPSTVISSSRSPSTNPPKPVPLHTPAKTPATKTVASPQEKNRSPVVTAPPKSVMPAPRKGQFIWPVKGRVVKNFGNNEAGPSKGLEIAVPRGTAVVSSGAGRVIYSGNGIRGYGNLIILKHDNSYFTVYGFNDKNLVAVDTFVSRGEKIALSGVPAGGGEPRVHFEIRQGKEAVNPSLYLP